MKRVEGGDEGNGGTYDGMELGRAVVGLSVW